MSNLTPVSSLDDVYQIETTDVVLGGPGQVANSQAQALLNRTTFLNERSQKILTPGSQSVTLTTANSAVKLFSYKHHLTGEAYSEQHLDTMFAFDIHYGGISISTEYKSLCRSYEFYIFWENYSYNFLKMTKMSGEMIGAGNLENSPYEVYLIVQKREDIDGYTYYDFYLDDQNISVSAEKDIEIIIYDDVKNILQSKITFESSLSAIAKMYNVSSGTTLRTSIFHTINGGTFAEFTTRVIASARMSPNHTPNTAIPTSVIDEKRIADLEGRVDANELAIGGLETDVGDVQDDVTGLQNTIFAQWEYVIPGTYSWTCPLGITSIKLLVVGGGGGGAGGRVANEGHGGGGGGAAAHNAYTVVPETVYEIVVGSGGTGGLTNVEDQVGGTGGNSYFNVVNSVIGGGGGGGQYGAGSAGAGGISYGGQYNVTGGPGTRVNNPEMVNPSGASGGGGGANIAGGNGAWGAGGGAGGGGSTITIRNGGNAGKYGGNGGNGGTVIDSTIGINSTNGSNSSFGGVPGLSSQVGLLSSSGGGGGCPGGGGGGGGASAAAGGIGGAGGAGMVIIRLNGSNFNIS